MNRENFGNNQEDQPRETHRRAFLKASVLAGLGAGLLNKSAVRGRAEELENSNNLKNISSLEREVFAYGETGDKLPPYLQGAIKRMPKGRELKNTDVVYVTDHEKYLTAKKIYDPQVRRLEREIAAEVVNNQYPIYINGSLFSMQEAVRDPEAQEVLCGVLIHERLHVTNPEMPHSQIYAEELKYLDEKFKSGLIPLRYKEYIEKIRVKQHECEEREKNSPSGVTISVVR